MYITKFTVILGISSIQVFPFTAWKLKLFSLYLWNTYIELTLNGYSYNVLNYNNHNWIYSLMQSALQYRVLNPQKRRAQKVICQMSEATINFTKRTIHPLLSLNSPEPHRSTSSALSSTSSLTRDYATIQWTGHRLSSIIRTLEWTSVASWLSTD